MAGVWSVSRNLCYILDVGQPSKFFNPWETSLSNVEGEKSAKWVRSLLFMLGLKSRITHVLSVYYDIITFKRTFLLFQSMRMCDPYFFEWLLPPFPSLPLPFISLTPRYLPFHSPARNDGISLDGIHFAFSCSYGGQASGKLYRCQEKVWLKNYD